MQKRARRKVLPLNEKHRRKLAIIEKLNIAIVLVCKQIYQIRKY